MAIQLKPQARANFMQMFTRSEIVWQDVFDSGPKFISMVKV